MIEKSTGMTYRNYVREHIFDRCGMNDSDFLRQDRVNERTAEGVDPLFEEAGNILGWKKNIYAYPPVGSPDGGANVTAGDLDRFIYALKDRLLLSSDMTQVFFTPQVNYRIKDDWTMMYGYGLWFYVDQADNIVCYQKEGINAGASGLFRHFPKQNINVVILSNMMDGVWGPVWKIHEEITGGQFDA
jgi:CubicO group peptidase (beta-lactamase class C family)